MSTFEHAPTYRLQVAISRSGGRLNGTLLVLCLPLILIGMAFMLERQFLAGTVQLLAVLGVLVTASREAGNHG